jgi:uncharacterized damage-inducible protein DinB
MRNGRKVLKFRREIRQCRRMDATTDRLFLDASVRRLRQMTERLQACLDRLTEDQIWMRGAETQNAVGNLILHLCGNLRQWIIAGVGQTTFERDRDAEFAARGGVSSRELLERLNRTVEDAAGVILRVSPERLAEHVRIQAYDVTVLEAIYHVIEHFAQHYGQITFATKLFTEQDLGFYAHLSKRDHGRQTP